MSDDEYEALVRAEQVKEQRKLAASDAQRQQRLEECRSLDRLATAFLADMASLGVRPPARANVAQAPSRAARAAQRVSGWIIVQMVRIGDGRDGWYAHATVAHDAQRAGACLLLGTNLRWFIGTVGGPGSRVSPVHLEVSKKGDTGWWALWHSDVAVHYNSLAPEWSENIAACPPQRAKQALAEIAAASR